MSDSGSVPASTEKSPMETAAELREMLTSYARQETVTPLKQLAKWVGFGVGGALLVTIGLFLLALSGLRALQSETTAFDGNLSWLPYVIVVAALGVFIGMAAWAITRGPPDDGGTAS